MPVSSFIVQLQDFERERLNDLRKAENRIVFLAEVRSLRIKYDTAEQDFAFDENTLRFIRLT
jgi:hypothetical protein